MNLSRIPYASSLISRLTFHQLQPDFWTKLRSQQSATLLKSSPELLTLPRKNLQYSSCLRSQAEQNNKDHVIVLEDTEARVTQKAVTFLKTFASEPYSEEKCNRAIDSAILDYYKLDKQLLQSLVIKQRVRKVHVLGEEHGMLLITRDNTAIYKPVANAPFGTSLEFPLASVKGLLKMRHLFKHKSLEIFLHNKTASLFLEFETEAVLEIVSEYLHKHCKNLDPHFADVEYNSQLWVDGKLSNYDYLLFLNRIASRTFNDLSQYPVFPWVLSEYYSSSTCIFSQPCINPQIALDLSNPEVYRDLSKPIGALNAKKLEKYKVSSPFFVTKIAKIQNDGPTRFHLQGISLRVHVLDSKHCDVLFDKTYSFLLTSDTANYLWTQGKIHDEFGWGMERHLLSIRRAKRGCSRVISQQPQNRFYDPENTEFLLNLNGLNFGKTHTGESIENVELPPWARSATECVEKLREALESDYVSQRLHHWIDLIFGCKQKGSAAFTADNLFDHQAYEENADWTEYEKDPGKYEAFKLCISQFGQIPRQVFAEPHPQRKRRVAFLEEIKPEEAPCHEDLANLLLAAQDEIKSLKDELEKTSKGYDESLKQHYGNYKAYEEKCKQRNERLRSAYKEQKEKYRKAIGEVQQKNVALKEDFEQLDQKKEKHYLSIMKSMRDNYKREITKYASKSQSAAHIKELEKRIQKYQGEEKKHLMNVEKLMETNRQLKNKTNELQRKLATYEENAKGKPISPTHFTQRPSLFKQINKFPLLYNS
eukprot:TRINITY_DN64738_c0_g1_i1.p1 TRINITY_DN64738_c0_g1~~TRINITY_DN64738_c0_g1_i1.p1  ORF type:complete len:763 (+),score=62.32 TRINITY_DN64738_c0_g1_i1:371-2659(+)